MTLLAAEWLWALWLVPLLVVVLVRARRRARARAAEFAGSLAPRLVRGGERRGLREGLLVAAFGTAVVALARPAWGVVVEQVESEGMDVVVALDVSRSMLARDAAPSRLERARIAIDDLVDSVSEHGGHRVGLLVFAGVPAVKAPLTTDYRYVRDVLAGIGPDDVGRGGTLIGDALRRAVSMLDDEGTAEHDRVVVLLTDGEDHESFPREAARAAAEAGVVVYAVGIGDESDGAAVPTAPGSRETVEHGGAQVVSRLDADTLREIADATGGGYLPAGTRRIPLGRVYDEAIAGRRTATRDGTADRRPRERFQWAAGLALLLVFGACLVGGTESSS